MTSVPQLRTAQYSLHDEDLPEDVYRELAASRQIAWDIETDGLDWSVDRIRLCQLYGETGSVALVRIGEQPPARLMSLLADVSVQKVFHHAMFDLRFMARHWTAPPRNVACTKVAAKLLFPQQADAQRLQSLLQRFLGVAIDKSEQTSNWGAPTYSDRQITYAIRDVIHLFDLRDALLAELDRTGRRSLAERCFAHIPARVELELGGFGDVFTY